MKKRERLYIVDVLTMMATIFVVMGHHKMLREFNITWFPVFDGILYSFHMGFFMTISGILVRYTFPINCEWKSYIGKKARKFIPAYFAVGLLAAILSFNTWTDFLKNLIMLFVNTCNGPIQIIWYIYVLFIFYCAAPFLFRLSMKMRYIIFAISLIPSAFCHLFPYWFNICIVFRLFPFFLFGTLVSDNQIKIENLSDSFLFICSIPFVAFVLCYIFLKINIITMLLNYVDLSKLISSFLSLPLLYYIGRMLKNTKVVFLAIKFSKYVYLVFLLQIFFINAIWLCRKHFEIELTNTTAILYLIISSFLSILGIICLVKIFELCKHHVSRFYKK